MRYVCSCCGDPAYYDGRCGDGPVLTCPCSKRMKFIPDRGGGFYVPENNAKPIPSEHFIGKKQ